jgi:hypothetical protein
MRSRGGRSKCLTGNVQFPESRFRPQPWIVASTPPTNWKLSVKMAVSCGSIPAA